MNWVPAAAAAKNWGVDRASGAKGGSGGGDQTEESTRRKECAAEQCFGPVIRQPRAETLGPNSIQSETAAIFHDSCRGISVSCREINSLFNGARVKATTASLQLT